MRAPKVSPKSSFPTFNGNFWLQSMTRPSKSPSGTSTLASPSRWHTISSRYSLSNFIHIPAWQCFAQVAGQVHARPRGLCAAPGPFLPLPRAELPVRRDGQESGADSGNFFWGLQTIFSGGSHSFRDGQRGIRRVDGCGPILLAHGRPDGHSHCRLECRQCWIHFSQGWACEPVEKRFLGYF
jgi:hypothetical protein